MSAVLSANEVWPTVRYMYRHGTDSRVKAVATQAEAPDLSDRWPASTPV